jgi:hypothetical protein
MTIADQLRFANQLGSSVHQALMVIAAPTPSPAPSPVINTNGIVDFIATKIAPILLAALGVMIISRAGKGEVSRVLTTSAIAIIGIGFIAGGTAMFFFGKNLVNLIFGG